MTYSAWVAKAAKQPLVRETLDPGPLSVEEVEVAVEHCGLCHTDLSVLNDEWGFSRYPAVLGHEIVGRVTALGSGTKGLELGQRVGIGWNAGSCLYCQQCLSGQQHLCSQAQPTIVGHRGGLATHVRSQWPWAIPLPETLSPADAGPLLCGGVTMFSPLFMYGKPTDRVGIVGIGGLGHLGIQFAAAFGCEVTAFTSSEDKFAEARRFGASHVVSTNDTNRLKKLSGKLDLLISTVNATLDWHALVGTLAPYGRLHLVGAMGEPVAISALALIAGHRSVSGSPNGSPSMTRAMLEFAARRRIAPQNEHFRMSQVNDAVARLAAGKARYRIVLDADF
jgi:alcohol/geraniol dehydrogenase (NADP+)